MSEGSDQKANEILRRHAEAEKARNQNASLWRDVAVFFSDNADLSFIHADKRSDKQADTERLADVFDSTGFEAAQGFASGCFEFVTPSTQPFFRLRMPDLFQGDKDAGNRWLSKCQDIMYPVLANSNFYPEVLNCYENVGIFGTTGFAVDPDEESALNFRAIPPWQFAILENHRGEVDSVFRRHSMTPRQAVQKFGEENLPQSTVERSKPDADGADDYHVYIHFIGPNRDYNPGKLGPEAMPFASVWVDEEARMIVSEGGTMEMPMPVARFKKTQSSPWGVSPAQRALPDMRQLSDLQMHLDTITEIQAFPRVKAHDSLEGRVDLRSGSVSYLGEDGYTLEEWGTSGMSQAMDNRVAYRVDKVQRHFYLPLFSVLATVPDGKVMTAAEVWQRQRDQLNLFAPVFGNLSTYLVQPAIRRAFRLMLRNGQLPPPPDSIVVRDEETGEGFMPEPEIKLVSRIAMQLEGMANSTLDAAFPVMSGIAQIAPSKLQYLNLDEAVPEYLRNLGMPENWIRSKEEVADMEMALIEEEMSMQQDDAEAQAFEESVEAAKLEPVA